MARPSSGAALFFSTEWAKMEVQMNSNMVNVARENKIYS